MGATTDRRMSTLTPEVVLAARVPAAPRRARARLRGCGSNGDDQRRRASPARASCRRGAPLYGLRQRRLRLRASGNGSTSSLAEVPVRDQALDAASSRSSRNRTSTTTRTSSRRSAPRSTSWLLGTSTGSVAGRRRAHDQAGRPGAIRRADRQEARRGAPTPSTREVDGWYSSRTRRPRSTRSSRRKRRHARRRPRRSRTPSGAPR